MLLDLISTTVKHGTAQAFLDAGERVSKYTKAELIELVKECQEYVLPVEVMLRQLQDNPKNPQKLLHEIVAILLNLKMFNVIMLRASDRTGSMSEAFRVCPAVRKQMEYFDDEMHEIMWSKDMREMLSCVLEQHDDTAKQAAFVFSIVCRPSWMNGLKGRS